MGIALGIIVAVIIVIWCITLIGWFGRSLRNKNTETTPNPIPYSDFDEDHSGGRKKKKKQFKRAKAS